jgi:hypothetical protein
MVYSSINQDITLPQIRHIHAARSVDMVQLRMNRNGNPEVCDTLDCRLLQWLAFRSHISAIKALLHHYGQVYPLSSFGTACLEEAHHILTPWLKMLRRQWFYRP